MDELSARYWLSHAHVHVATPYLHVHISRLLYEREIDAGELQHYFL